MSAASVRPARPVVRARIRREKDARRVSRFFKPIALNYGKILDRLLLPYPRRRISHRPNPDQIAGCRDRQNYRGFTAEGSRPPDRDEAGISGASARCQWLRRFSGRERDRFCKTHPPPWENTHRAIAYRPRVDDTSTSPVIARLAIPRQRGETNERRPSWCNGPTRKMRPWGRSTAGDHAGWWHRGGALGHPTGVNAIAYHLCCGPSSRSVQRGF